MRGKVQVKKLDVNPMFGLFLFPLCLAVGVAVLVIGSLAAFVIVSALFAGMGLVLSSDKMRHSSFYNYQNTNNGTPLQEKIDRYEGRYGEGNFVVVEVRRRRDAEESE